MKRIAARGPERALSAVTAALVLVIVIVVVGAGAFVAFSAVSPSPAVASSCSPPNSPACQAVLSDLHDLRLIVPIRSTQQGTPIPFSAVVPAGASTHTFTFNFGDGTHPLVSASPTVDHVYAFPGTYLVSLTADVNGATHDNARALAQVTIAPSYALNSIGNLPQVLGTVVANSSSTSSPTAVLAPDQSVTVSGSYSVAPTNPLWVATPPTLSAPGGTVQPPTITPSGVSARIIYPSPGEYTITFVGGAKGPGGATVSADYVWSVFVAPSGVHAGLGGAARPHSPHPGSMVAYELAPGGGSSQDPAIDYDISGDEVLMNVYQQLIFYNQSATGLAPQDFVPALATCVPGGAECQHLYGSTLLSGYNYTFVLASNQNFYDPYTGKSWPVYPSDVVFSIARTMGFADLPCQGCNNGWIITQALLPSGNSAWDNGFHAPYNNTPNWVFHSMSVNDTHWCPQVAMSQGHGCVTFHAWGGNISWPYFLELISDAEGGSVVPCGWYSSTASTGGQTGIPGWTQGTVPGSGDHPCLLPGGATSTTDPRFTAAVAGMSSTSWDTWENTCSGAATGTYCGQVQYRMAGSGPYYLSSYSVGLAYGIKANPAYHQNPDCTFAGCLPAPGAYPQSVEVSWESSALPGEQAMAAGVADFASIPSTDFALLLQYVESGKANVVSIPSITVYMMGFSLMFSISAAYKYTSNPIKVPADWFSYVGMREFFARAYPYTTAQATVNTKDGIQTGFNFGGAIPQFMGRYYPTNISWPAGDPCTDSSNPSCATYWWKQMTTVGSPYYDPEAVACATSQCQLPIFGAIGAPDTDARLALWSSELSTLSGGQIKATATDVSPIDIYNAGSDTPGTSPFVNYINNWAPDYPDPTDYIVPFYYPDNTFTYASAVVEQMGSTPFNSSACGHWNDYVYWADPSHPLPNNCQGTAYWAMLHAYGLAAPLPDGPARALLYNIGEQIANRLALYLYLYQANTIVPLAPWVDPSGYDTNILTGGGGDTIWFSLANPT